jgi:hypothetical protein
MGLAVGNGFWRQGAARFGVTALVCQPPNVAQGFSPVMWRLAHRTKVLCHL